MISKANLVPIPESNGISTGDPISHKLWIRGSSWSILLSVTSTCCYYSKGLVALKVTLEKSLAQSPHSVTSIRPTLVGLTSVGLTSVWLTSVTAVRLTRHRFRSSDSWITCKWTVRMRRSDEVSESRYVLNSRRTVRRTSESLSYPFSKDSKRLFTDSLQTRNLWILFDKL